jgi:hypothetical protein
VTKVNADIDALKGFHEALVRFRRAQRDVADRGDHEIEVTRASLEAKADRWQARLEQAQHDLEACEYRAAHVSEGHYMDCSGFARAVSEAQERLEHVRDWQRRVEDEAAVFSRSAGRFRNLLEADLPRTQNHVLETIKALEAARRVQAPGS